jgi:RNA polymerase sigma factor (sigma-70 family)
LAEVVVRESGFGCPLQGPCFSQATAGFSSYEAANQGVAGYLASATTEERDARAIVLFQGMLPLLRKTLRRFCPPARAASRCDPGGCLPEDLVGESYLAFREVLDLYDPTRGVDFVGFATQRLYWNLEHRARPLERSLAETAGGSLDNLLARENEEDLVLRSVVADDLLSRLERADAEILMQDACGYDCKEIAAGAGISATAVRKRIERARGKLRELGEDRS